MLPSVFAQFGLSPENTRLLAVARDIALIMGGIALMVIATLTFRTMREYRRVLRELRKRFLERVSPVSERVTSIADNVEFVTQALRTDVVYLNSSVKALTNRLHQASDQMEERIDEFNALMEVVQSEAEGIFLDTAATVRGVRAGARHIAGGTRPDVDEESIAARAMERAAADPVLARPLVARAVHPPEVAHVPADENPDDGARPEDMADAPRPADGGSPRP